MQNETYNEIKERLIDVEATEKVKNYTINKVKLDNYYEIGKLLVEAQGGEERAKYGDNILKEYANKLTNDLGKCYSWRNLYNMRSFYLLISNNPILQPLVAKLNWTHYTILLSLKDINEIKYYIDLCISLKLGKRELHQRIKNNEYKNLDNDTKLRLINKEETTIVDKIPNPIVIDNPNNYEITQEKILHKLIMEQLPKFLKRLGDGYSYIGDEYPIKIGNKNNYIDFLLYNRIYRSFVVVELKLGILKKEDIGQITYYMNYIDKEEKDITDDKTIGIILGYKDNDFIMKYTSDNRIIFREYTLN